MSEAPAELWVTPANLEDEDEEAMAGLYIETSSDAPDAVRYVRADLYEALRARLDGLLEQMTVVRSWNEAPCREPFGTDYPR